MPRRIKAGLEIHQQLKASRKLFCNCKPELIQEEPDFVVVRELHPSVGETEEMDKTMLLELKKGKRHVYQGYNDHTCLYEIDETPPILPSEEHIRIAVRIAKAFDAKILPIRYVMRKQYLDGSVPSGFQRTMMIAHGGYVPLSNGKKVRIRYMFLEEDAARKIEEKPKEVIRRVDRLGIPLIEISTEPDMESAEEVREAAEKIGLALRFLGVAKRGIGTIRQDVNVSVEGGARVEIKGVQMLDRIVPLIENEVRRQEELLKIAQELQRRKVLPEEIMAQEPKDVTDILKKSKSKLVHRVLKSKKNKARALKVPKFKGIFGRELIPGKRRFGTEVADRVRVLSGLAGILHSDELPGYGIDEGIVNSIAEALEVGENDAFVIVMGPEEKLKDAIDAIVDRCIEAIYGVPSETRRAKEDGTTEFERFLGGGARMYPETDLPPIIVPKEILEEEPEMKFREAEERMREHGIPEEHIREIVREGLFEALRIIVEMGFEPKRASSMLVTKYRGLVKAGRINHERMDTEKIVAPFKAYKEGKIAKEGIETVRVELSKGKSLEEAIKAVGTVSEDEIREYARKVIEENAEFIRTVGPKKAFGRIMGAVMKKYRGKLEGRRIKEIVEEELEKFSRVFTRLAGPPGFEPGISASAGRRLIQARPRPLARKR